MRAVSGPDISAFQQSYKTASAGMHDNDEEYPLDFADRTYPSIIPVQATTTPPLAPVELYRQEMLPRRPAPREPLAPPPSRDSFGAAADMSIDNRLEALRREMRAEPRQQPQKPSPEPPTPPPIIRREPGMSLRESILKKPLSSLYDKD
jgi:hypothetical protein